MMRAAIYCRLSEEDRNKRFESDDSNSIKNQKALLLQYAAEKEWEVVKVYSDDDYTGSDRNRPAFKQLIADAGEHKFDIVLCKSQSRFTREMELVEKYIHCLFPLWNIRFVSLVDNADTNNKGNKKSRQINGLVNEWYLEDMSENIKSVLVNRRQNGFHIGSFALYGYKKDPEQKGHLVIDEEAARIVREVFTLFSQGYGKTAIARMLNDRGIPNPTEYKRLHGLRYHQPKKAYSTLWKYPAISDMLVNEMYIGNMVQGKYGSVSYKTKVNKPRPKEDWYRVEGTHEPIIDRGLWERVQSMIRERAKPFGTGTIGIFAKKVRCAGCGYTMRSSKNRGKHYLTCSSRYAAKDACSGTFISVEKLERAVIFELNKLSSDYLDTEKLLQSIDFSDSLETQRSHLVKELDVYQKKAEEFTRGISGLYLDKIKGIVSESDYLSMSKYFASEKERLEQMAQQSRLWLKELDIRIADGDDRSALLRQYTQPDHLTREMVETLIDHIVVGKRASGEKAPPMEIHWNF